MPIRLNGETSGSIELDVPAAVGSDLQLTLPATAGEVVVQASDGSVDLGDVEIDSSGRLLVGVSSSSQVNTAVFQGNSAAGSAGAVVLSSTINNPSSTQTIGKLAFSDNGHVDAASIKGTRDGGTWTSGSSQPSALKFFTTADTSSSATERMRIHSGGEVTKSSQPAAACHDSTGWFIFNNGDVFTFNDPAYNVGSNYSTATGRFTAPVDGYYLVTANLYFDTASGNYNNPFYINKNGSQYAPSGSASPWAQHVIGAGSGDQTNGFSYVIYLSEDDYIELKFGSQVRVFRRHSHMTITLLH